jgi:hypothetical protein
MATALARVGAAVVHQRRSPANLVHRCACECLSVGRQWLSGGPRGTAVRPAQSALRARETRRTSSPRQVIGPRRGPSAAAVVRGGQLHGPEVIWGAVATCSPRVAGNVCRDCSYSRWSKYWLKAAPAMSPSRRTQSVKTPKGTWSTARSGRWRARTFACLFCLIPRRPDTRLPGSGVALGRRQEGDQASLVHRAVLRGHRLTLPEPDCVRRHQAGLSRRRGLQEGCRARQGSRRQFARP